MGLYYLGLKRKTIQNNNYFNKAIVVRGGCKDKGDINYFDLYNCDIDYNILSNFSKISEYYADAVRQISLVDNNAKFVLYNQAAIEYMDDLSNIICVNDISLVKKLNNKPISRELLSDCINVLEYKYLPGNKISYNVVSNLYNGKFEKYVIQQPAGFGGIGTFLLTAENSDEIINQLDKSLIYSISGYVESSSVNNTFMISDNHIHIFDGSMQLIIPDKELSYDGWDFDKYKKLTDIQKQNIYNQTLNIVTKLQLLGYRGIGGVDYIVSGNDVYFMEINPRFQASSEELDKMLVNQGFPSIFELNYYAFYNQDKFLEIVTKLEK